MSKELYQVILEYDTLYKELEKTTLRYKEEALLNKESATFFYEKCVELKKQLDKQEKIINDLRMDEDIDAKYKDITSIRNKIDRVHSYKLSKERVDEHKRQLQEKFNKLMGN